MGKPPQTRPPKSRLPPGSLQSPWPHLIDFPDLVDYYVIFEFWPMASKSARMRWSANPKVVTLILYRPPLLVSALACAKRKQGEHTPLHPKPQNLVNVFLCHLGNQVTGCHLRSRAALCHLRSHAIGCHPGNQASGCIPEV